MMKRKDRARRAANESAATTPLLAAALSGVSPSKVAELAVDVWRIESRARKEGAGDRVVAACERAVDRLRSMGFSLDSLEGRPYDENLRVRVVDHEDAEGPRTVLECVSPAVYHDDVLVREAEVVTRGS